MTGSILAARPLVIAHRGASGYLPEHTLAAKALAIGQGAHVVEQDVVLTRDGVPIVSHEVELEQTTDIAERYPDRASENGHWLAADFSWQELRQVQRKARGDRPRFAADVSFLLVRLEEELAFCAELERVLERPIGVHIELKKPNWHRSRGLDPSAALTEVLRRSAYLQRPDRVFLQCFEIAELDRLRGTALPRVLLLGGEETSPFRDPATFAELRRRVEGVGPWYGLLDRSWVEAAHAADLFVHPYTFRADDVPDTFSSFAAWVRRYAIEFGVDGLFTDHPDRALAALSG